MIEKDDLYPIATAIEVMTYVIGDLSKCYFDKYDRDKEGDHAAIVWEFRHNRARAQVLSEYIFMLANTLKELGIKY